MEKKEGMVNGSNLKDEEMEGACRATGIFSSLDPHRSRGISVVQDPEVPGEGDPKEICGGIQAPNPQGNPGLWRSAPSWRPSTQGRSVLLLSDHVTQAGGKGDIGALSSKKRGPKARKPDTSRGLERRFLFLQPRDRYVRSMGIATGQRVKGEYRAQETAHTHGF